MANPERVALTALPRKLAALTGREVPSYRKFWQMVVDGRLPAIQVNGRYQVDPADYPAICATLGLHLKDEVPATSAKHQRTPKHSLIVA